METISLQPSAPAFAVFAGFGPLTRSRRAQGDCGRSMPATREFGFGGRRAQASAKDVALDRPLRGWTGSRRSFTAAKVWAVQTPGACVSEIETELHDLMVRGLAGDAGAHRRLLEQLGDRFRVFFRGRMRVGDPSFIEDLVQETLIAVHTRRESYNPEQPLRAWVYAIARYKLIDHFRRTKTTGISVPVDEVDDLFSNEEADSSDPARDVAALLEHLPQKQRVAIRLVKLEELSVREAAAQTGMSESDIKISIHRGMKKLSALVAKEGQP